MPRNIKKAVVMGSGPNGLAAAITLINSGVPVTLFEESKTTGGTCRSQEIIEPGYIHDLGAAVHPMALNSPFFKKVPLTQLGLKWIHPPAALAHPFDDGTALLLTDSIYETSSMLDPEDERSYQRLMKNLVEHSKELITEVMYFPSLKVSHPKTIISFGLRALHSVVGLSNKYFQKPRAKALLAGLGAHSIMNLYTPFSSAAGIILGVLAHTTGWPFPETGAQRITDSLATFFIHKGGTIVTDHKISSLTELSSQDLIFLDLTPEQFLQLTDSHLPSLYKKKLSNYTYGPSIFKMDWILKEPIPWKAKECQQAGTLHLGGTLQEIAEAERQVFQGEHPEKPFLILVQPTLFDKKRTRDTHEIIWAYCHVPHNSTFNMEERIEAQIERFAPGFKECIITRKTTDSKRLNQIHPNCIGGDIGGGRQSIRRLLLPSISYRTPLPHVLLCSSTTPPGPGVHGMCGERAVEYALRRFKVL